MKKYYYIVAIILVVAGGSYYWYAKNKSSQTQTQYVTATAEKGTLISSISASGNIAVDQSATVDPTISGTVANLTVQVGDSVEEGQLLFTIINEDLDVSVKKALTTEDQAENTVESAEISEDEAEENYDIAVKEDKKDGTTHTTRQLEVLKDKIDLAEAEVWEAKKNLAAAEASYNNELSNAEKRKVTAPISGTVNEINIKNGDDLGKTSTSAKLSPIIIGDLNTLKAQVQVNEVDIPNVTIGQKVTLKFDALTNFTATGQVEKIDSLGTITQNVVTYDVTIGFDTLDPRIKPEMSVSASIITDARTSVLSVPNGAIKTDGGKDYVEVLKGEAPEQVTVEIGVTNNTDTEIISGIKEGDKVVTQTINSSSNANTNSSSRSGGFRIPGLGGGPRD
jgi:HlyD family secretion protein